MFDLSGRTANLKGAFLVAQAADAGGRARRRDRQRRVDPRPARRGGLAAYAASKAGLVQITKALALEWARHLIRVNALCPGYIETNLNLHRKDPEVSLAKPRG